jgi:hypothetical protein
VVEDARAKLFAKWPEQTRVLADENAALRDVGARNEHGIRRAIELGLRISNRKSLEEGVAYQQSLERLANVVTFAGRLARIRVDARDARQADMTVHTWVTYLYAHIDVTRRLIGVALGQLVGEEDAAHRLRDDLRTWSTARKRALGELRHTVAHAEPTFVRAIDEERLWEPMVLLGHAGAPELLDMIRSATETSNFSFNRRVRDLRDASGMLVAQSDKWCETAASLGSSKRKR